jgi:hypothetical protein
MGCKYSTLFGEPNKGIHSTRFHIGNQSFALVDTVATVIGAYLLKKYYFTDYSFFEVLLGLFLLGIVLHKLFCVKTTVDKLIFA